MKGFNRFNIVHESFRYGKKFKIGSFNHIHENVICGDNVEIKSYVEIRPLTKIGNNVYIDSGVKISGECDIMDNVIIRYDSIIARNVIICPNVFISPQVMFINIPAKKREIKKVTIIHEGVFLGTNCTIHDGVEIFEDIIIGAKANVRKSLYAKGTYVGGIDNDLVKIS